MNKKRYAIVCDESKRKGENFSYFYGGAILLENKYEKISAILNEYKAKYGLNEIKRNKITNNNYKYYIKVLDLFFTFVKSGDIKVRVMFTPNNQLERLSKPNNFTFTKFYLNFILYAFSIFYAKEPLSLRLIFDDLPETKEQCVVFKDCLIRRINHNHIKDRRYKHKVETNADSIEEVDSKKHPILQCVDVIVGLVDFALNIPLDQQTSVRSTAKQKVWEFIKSNIDELHNNFDFVKTTNPIYSIKGWQDKYKHFIYTKK